MKIIRLAFMLSIIPFLNGCLSMCAMNAAKNPDARVLHERTHVEKAAVSKDNQLLIFLKGSFTNSPSGSLFTVVIPMSQIETDACVNYLPGTNGMRFATLNVPRNLIHQGWLSEGGSNDVEIVPLGSPISTGYLFPEGFARDIPETAKLLPNASRTLYQVRLDGYSEFVYIDASDKWAYTDLQIVPATYTPARDVRYYFWLPITVPVDVATSPIQVPCLIFLLWALGHSHGC